MKPVVLFVDDEPQVLSGLRRSLRSKRESWDMHFATGGAAALEFLATQNVDVLVSDMRMPDIDGAAVMDTCQSQAPNAARYILSGEADRSATHSTIGCSHRFLAKPSATEAIIDAIDGPLAQRRDGFESWRVAQLSHLANLEGVGDDVEAAIAGDEPDLNAAAAAIERDPGLTLRVLQLVNNAYFGPRRATLRVLDAINRLGLPTLQALIAERRFCARDVVTPQADTAREEPAAADLARSAHDLAIARSASAEQADLAYATGLLMRVGGQVLYEGAHPPRELHTPIASYLTALVGLPAAVSRALADLASMAFIPSPGEGAAAIVDALAAPQGPRLTVAAS